MYRLQYFWEFRSAYPGGKLKSESTSQVIYDKISSTGVLLMPLVQVLKKLLAWFGEHNDRPLCALQFL